MKKKFFSKTALTIFTTLTAVLSLVSCGKQKLDDTPLENLQTIANFSTGKNDSFFASHGWCNGDVFNVTWNENNIKYEDGAAKLLITQSDDVYYGGELRSTDHFHYGDYEITMKPEAKKGTCTSFFIYTGPSETDENGNPNPHDEIDIEFVGKDTTHVQFNYFVNGKGGNEYKYDLGFDASKEFHTYGFRWAEDYITWYVDGVPVYRVDETSRKPLPSTPGRIMMNYWCGTLVASPWMGIYSDPQPDEASEYKLVKSSATPIVDESENKTPDVPSVGIDWENTASLVDLNAESSDGSHNITKSNADYNVVYSNINGGTYSNVKFDLGSKINDKNYLYLNATNNSTESVNIRVDIFGDATRKTNNNKNVCNVSATMDGSTVFTDLDWGGSSFNNIAAGATVEIIIYFEGVADSIQIMFDSSIYGDTKKYSGDVTISSIKFGVEGDVLLPEGSDTPDVPSNPDNNETPVDPVIPVAGEININGAEKVFEGNLEKYILVYNENVLSASYSNVVGNSYLNINTQISDIASSKNVFTVKITNNGDVAVKVRIDIDSNTKVNETTASNVSATQDGAEVYTDTQWGGSTFTIAANSSSVCSVVYETSRGPKMLMFYIDSSQYDDSTAHSGSVSFSEMVFSGEGATETPVVPETPNTDSCYLEFTTDGSYTVTNDSVNKKTDVTYDNIKDSTYKCINTNFTNLVGSNNVISVTIINNGDAEVSLRFDVGYDNGGSLTSTIVSTVGADFNAGEKNAACKVAAGSSVTINLVFDNTIAVTGMNIFIDSAIWVNDEADKVIHSGNITICNIAFSESN